MVRGRGALLDVQHSPVVVTQFAVRDAGVSDEASSRGGVAGERPIDPPQCVG